MTDYTITTNFGAKDSLPSGNAAKVIKGSEFTTEFTNIATAVNSKADTAGDTFTGVVNFSADVAFDTDTLFVDVSTDRVGMGTTSPADELHLNASKSGGDVVFRIQNSAVTTGDTATLRFCVTSDVDHDSAFIGSDRTNSLILGSDLQERMRIDARGTCTLNGPNYSFQSENYHLRLTEDDGSCYLSNVQGGLYFSSGGYYYGSGQFKLTDGATSMSTILCAQNGNIGFYTTAGGSANGVVTANERMRIDSGGHVLIGTTDTSLHTNNASGANSNGAMFTPHGEFMIARYQEAPILSNRMGNDGSVLSFYNRGSFVGKIQSTSVGVSLQSGSDRKLKQNIEDADDAGSLIDSVQIRQFDWIRNGEHQSYGVVAQELEEVLPELVSGHDEESLTVDYMGLVPMLIKEVQALRSRVAQLEESE